MIVAWRVPGVVVIENAAEMFFLADTLIVPGTVTPGSELDNDTVVDAGTGKFRVTVPVVDDPPVIVELVRLTAAGRIGLTVMVETTDAPLHVAVMVTVTGAATFVVVRVNN